MPLKEWEVKMEDMRAQYEAQQQAMDSMEEETADVEATGTTE